MKRYSNKTPEDVNKIVTTEIILRAIKLSRKKNRQIFISVTTVGKGTEILQMVWLDNFKPELIFIGYNILLGAFTRLTVHVYEGSDKFHYGIIEIGSNCKFGAGTGMGPIKLEDNV
ncbi:MAG: hypothetical protein FJ214_12485 [Ignavibacteria bacterium]|nr:hypothetical protein [Ignavibacteria bacterium]